MSVVAELAELTELAAQLNLVAAQVELPDIKEPLERLSKSAMQVEKSWCGSWLGYQSRVYYQGFGVPPRWARFSIEMGLNVPSFMDETVGDWEEFDHDEVITEIEHRAQQARTDFADERSKIAADLFDDSRKHIQSLMSRLRTSDSDLDRLVSEMEKLMIGRPSDFLSARSPSSPVISSDTRALQGGFTAPPHICTLAYVLAVKSPFENCAKLARLVRQAVRHLDLVGKQFVQESNTKKIFFGHGHSHDWLVLKTFVQDNLGLPCDEYDRVSTAGRSHKERLEQMLDEAAIAFIVVTAEDAQLDGTFNPRLNVVHEHGLFAGKLGFERSIIVLEDGCSDFSNVHGMGHIPYPRGNIKAAFEEIRRVIGREGIL